jgi:hypothetical protein
LLATTRRSRLRETQQDGRLEIELATNVGQVVAVFLWFPLALLGLGWFYDMSSAATFAVLGGFVVLSTLATVLIVTSWAFRRIVRIAVMRDGLSIEAHGATTTLSFPEIQSVQVFKYPKSSDAYGLDVLRKDGTRVEVRAWNPLEREAIEARDRLTYLIERAREDPYRQ